MARLTIERAIQNLFFKDDFQELLLREPNLDSDCPLHALKQKNIVNFRCEGINTFLNQNLNQCFRYITFLALKELDINLLCTLIAVRIELQIAHLFMYILNTY